MVLVCVSWSLNVIFLIISYILLIPLFFCVIQGSIRKYVEVKIEKRLTNIIGEKDLMKHSDSRLLQPRLPVVEDPYFEYSDSNKRASISSIGKSQYYQLPTTSNHYQPRYQNLPPRIDTNAYWQAGPQLHEPQYMPISPIQSEAPQYLYPSPTSSDGYSNRSHTFNNPTNPHPYYENSYSANIRELPKSRSSRGSTKEKRTLSAKNSIKRFSDASSNVSSPSPFSHFQ
eukprot:NODE_952_length_2813_cov_0.164333.p1 type:complete len:228 gc:universal NODE_952_length_2813_cov_0.164333:1448-765(-)